MSSRRIVPFLLLFALLSCFALSEEGPIPCGDRAARPSPAWVRDAVIYEVFTRSFSEEGTFRAVERELPRLRKLGVTVIWLMPIHRIGQINRKGHLGSPYAVQDYYSIDPMHGTADDLRSLVRAAHGQGMHVIIDIVANHTSWDSAMLKENPAYFTQKDGKVIPPVPDWTDVADLNYDNPATRTYIIEMLKYWVRDFDLDGFRCDVANLVPTDFWDEARAALDTVKPELIMLAEGDWPQQHLKAFDVTYSWWFYEALVDVLVRGKDATVLKKTLTEEASRFPRGSLFMRFNDNHDKIRAVNLLGDDGALVSAGLCATLPGVPMLYNGQEIGDPVPSNDPALFEKYDILWVNHPPRMNRFSTFYGRLLATRAASPALRQGDLQFLETDRPAEVLAFSRSSGESRAVVVANLSNRPVRVKVQGAAGAVPAGLPAIFPEGGKPLPAAGQMLDLPPYGFCLFGH